MLIYIENRLKWVGLILETTQICSGVGVSWQGPFSCNKSPGSLNSMLFNIRRVLQRRFWTGTDYMEAVQEVIMTRIVLL